MKVVFQVTVEMPEDEIDRCEEPYYVTLDVEGKVYDVSDIRFVGRPTE